MSNERLHVLLIDDDEAGADLVRDVLSGHAGRFDLVVAPTLAQAITHLGACRYDVALLDLTLPDSSGLASVAAISARFPETPVVVLTELADDQIAFQALDCGAQDYLPKGQAAREQLPRTLRHAIQRHQIQHENQRLVAKLEHLAHHDSLTELLNRHSFSAELARDWEHSLRSSSPLACVMLDADFFKRINDTYGHPAGDRVLKKIADVLRDNTQGAGGLREPAPPTGRASQAARFGGEEFCVLLPETDEAGALRWAEHVRQQIASEAIVVGGDQLRITASFGVAERLPDTEQMTELVTHADEALRIAKQLGRNQVVGFGRARSIANDAGGTTNGPFGDARAEDVMAPLVLYLRETHSYEKAVELLLSTRLESLPVVDRDGKLCGLISDEDLIARLLTEETWKSTLAESIRSKTVCFHRDASIGEVSEFLRRSAVRRIVVVDEDDKPIGMISGGTILRWMRNAQKRLHAARELAQDVGKVPSTLARITGALERLQREVKSLQGEVLDEAEDPSTSLIGGATRIQALLDESLSQAHRNRQLRTTASAT